MGWVEAEVELSAFLAPPKAFVVAGGATHRYPQACESVVELLGDLGVECTVVEEPAAIGQLDHDILVVDALWWRMLPEQYDDRRGEWARELTEACIEALDAHLDAGRPVLALHTALLCFDDWPRWAATVGASWQWGRSYHPLLGDEPIGVNIVSSDHPIVAGLDDFAVVDERYSEIDVATDIEVLAESDGQPVIWTWTTGHGSRVVTDLLGHDRRSVEHPSHREILRRATDWLLDC